MLKTYQLNGDTVDSLDLKALVVTQGVKVSDEIYKRFGQTHRIYPDPQACNHFVLPDSTPVHVTDTAVIMRLMEMTIEVEQPHDPELARQLQTPFALEVSADDKPVLLHKGAFVTEVTLPPASRFYEQKTSSGLPFVGNSVLLGNQYVAFQCLWPCELAKAGYACQFCYPGATMQRLVKEKKPDVPTPTPTDVAEIVRFAIVQEKAVAGVQITGGSTMNPQAECRLILEYLNEIERVVGMKNIPGEMLVFTTPPTDPSEVDALFAAGTHRIACSIEVWDENLAKVITPGKWKFTGRQRHLNALTYIAEKYGPNKACSVFIVGLEPAESLLAGAEYLAQRGVVPVTSVWIPFGRRVMGKATAPGLDYFRRVKEGLAEIYMKYKIVLPVSCPCGVCSDVWDQQIAIGMV